jgi:hypothetical protein
MKTAAELPSTDGAIWARIMRPDAADLSRDAAQSLLNLDFTPADRTRMDELAEKARAGKLTSQERKDAESFNRVAHLLALFQSKARLSLRARKQR